MSGGDQNRNVTTQWGRWLGTMEENREIAVESSQETRAGNEKQLSKHIKGNILEIHQEQQDGKVSFFCSIDEGVGFK